MTNTPSQTTGVQMLEVSPELAGQRIENVLRTQLKGVPKTLIYRILRKGEVRVNKGRIKPEYKLQAGDVVFWEGFFKDYYCVFFLSNLLRFLQGNDVVELLLLLLPDGRSTQA